MAESFNDGGHAGSSPKPAEPDDPFLLTPASTAGDASLMLDAIIEEFAAQGWAAGRIEALFQDPFYSAPAALCAQFGLADVRVRIADAVARRSTIRIRMSETTGDSGTQPAPFAV